MNTESSTYKKNTDPQWEWQTLRWIVNPPEGQDRGAIKADAYIEKMKLPRKSFGIGYTRINGELYAMVKCNKPWA